MSDLSILPVAIFIGMMVAFALVMLFVTVTDKDPVQDRSVSNCQADGHFIACNNPFRFAHRCLDRE